MDAFESHRWRVVDARTGEVLQELVSAPGDSLVPIRREGDGVASRCGIRHMWRCGVVGPRVP